MIIKFFTKAIAIIVCFERFQAERGSSKQLLFFFLWHKIKCTYGTPRQIWVKGYRPRVIFKASWPLVKKSMSTTVVQKKIYILTCPLCIFIIYQFRWGQRQRTHFLKKWKSASLVSVFTTSKKYDRFFKAFSFGTRKKCISWHYFMQVVNVYFHGI